MDPLGGVVDDDGEVVVAADGCAQRPGEVDGHDVQPVACAYLADGHGA